MSTGSPNSRSSVRVIIVDSNRIGSQLLAAALKREHFDIVYAGSTREDALKVIAGTQADVALISGVLEGQPEKGYELARQLRVVSPRLQTIMLVESCNRESVIRAFRSGARGIFGRDDSLDILGKCVNRVHQGQIWASSSALHFMVEALVAPPRMNLVTATGSDILSPREQEVVHWVFEGLTNREVAMQMGLSENTIKNYLFRIFDKLGVSKRVELILYAASQIDTGSPSTTAPAARLSFDPATALNDDHFLFEWCRAAAEKYSLIQMLLAELYREGRGVQQDKVRAFAWYGIAERVATECIDHSQSARQQLQAELSQIEVAKAKRILNDWIQKSRQDSPSPRNDELKTAV